jgi:hypothetical protein
MLVVVATDATGSVSAAIGDGGSGGGGGGAAAVAAAPHSRTQPELE